MPVNLSIAFWLAFGCTLVGPLFAPTLHLLYFAPYLVITYYKKNRFTALWHAFGCGLLIDLFSSSTFFGMTSVNYCLTAMILYGQKRNFFEDKLFTLSLMTSLFAALSTLIAFFLAFFLDHKISFSWMSAFSELIAMPLCDGAYALLFFSLPFQLTRKLGKIVSNRRNSEN